MNFRLICLAAALVQVAVDGGRRIAGGEAIQIEEAPYTVSLQRLFLKKLRHYCGGVLISVQFVLTAAHRIKPISPVKVRLGSTASDEGGTLVDVASNEVHPNWNKKMPSDFDIAVIRLKTFVIFSESIAPIEMVSEGDESKVGEMSKVTGWGATKKIYEFPKCLRAVQVPIVSLEVCRSTHHENEPKVTDQMICAGFLDGDKDACNGDSGGPLVRVSDGLLIGLVSWGDKCGKTNHPGVYQKISHHRNWIVNVTGV